VVTEPVEVTIVEARKEFEANWTESQRWLNSARLKVPQKSGSLRSA